MAALSGPLPDDPAALKTLVGQLWQQVQDLQRQLTALKRRQYGPSSERFDPAQGRLDFGPEPEGVVPPVAPERPVFRVTGPREERKRGRRPLPQDLPRRRMEYTPAPGELVCQECGAAIGFEQAGFTHTALIDNDPHACATLRRNRPYWNVIEADMRRFQASYWNGVDLLAGGLPCPPFSIAASTAIPLA